MFFRLNFLKFRLQTQRHLWYFSTSNFLWVKWRNKHFLSFLKLQIILLIFLHILHLLSRNRQGLLLFFIIFIVVLVYYRVIIKIVLLLDYFKVDFVVVFDWILTLHSLRKREDRMIVIARLMHRLIVRVLLYRIRFAFHHIQRLQRREYNLLSKISLWVKRTLNFIRSIQQRLSLNSHRLRLFGIDPSHVFGWYWFSELVGKVRS